MKTFLHVVALGVALAWLPVPALAPEADGGTTLASNVDGCSRPPRRVRLPDTAHARVHFTGKLDDGRSVRGHGRYGFPADSVRELLIVVDWKGLERSHIQRLELYAPDGALYQRFTTGFSGAGRRAAPVETTLPVSGTPITQSSLFGEWCAEVYLDSDDAPIARQRFHLRPSH